MSLGPTRIDRPMVVGRFLELGWSGRAVLVAKLFGLAGIFVLAPWGWVTASIERAQLLGAAGSFGVLALYVAVLIVSYIAVVVSPFLRHTQSRVVFAFLGLVGFAVDLVVRDVTGSSLKIDMMQTLWQERAQAAGAFDAYAHTITAVLPAVACLFAASAIAPPRTFSLDLRYAVFPILALGLAVELMYVTREDVISEIPSPVSAPAQFVMAASSGVRYRGARDAVSYPKAVEPRFKNIVYIVDESIRADYLGVNNPRINNTPFLNSVSGKIANFGVAISSTNCSRGARYILRTGLREDQLPDANEVGLHQPSIWQYAKYAGFRTLHLDAFSSFDPMHSFMNEAESKSIDSVIEPKPEPFWELDRRVADALVKALEASDQPKFIFVEKFGLHPPWKRSLPESFQFDVSGVESLPAKLSNAQKRKVGTYLKGVRWSVDLFFELTYKALSRTDTLVIYTSDHGQAMYEGGYEASHCTKNNPHLGEAMVPLIVFTGEPVFQAKLAAAASRAYNHANHFDIYPQVLAAMGYDEAWVRENFGTDLMSIPEGRKRRFTSTQPLKSKAIWINVD